MLKVKENDTTYVCRYYQAKGPLIRWETYKNEALSIANGTFAWYNISGNIDSMVTYNNNNRTGTLNYYNSINSNENTNSYDSPSEFRGGVRGWSEFLSQNLIPPERFNSIVGPNSKGTAILIFTVAKDGKVINPFIYKSVKWSFDDEVLRIIKKSPKWVPALKNGEPVSHLQKQSITLKSF